MIGKYEPRLRFWCQTVMPLIYDDSLSYYELLNKVVKYLNNTIDDMNKIIGELNPTDNPIVQIVSDHQGLINSTAPLVYVCKNDSTFDELKKYNNSVTYSTDAVGDGGGCWFWTFTNNNGLVPNCNGYQRANGDMVFAMPDQSELADTDAPMTSIMNTFASYYNRDSLTYGRDNTLFNPNFNSETTHEIDCSDLMTAMLYGISYDDSKYSGKTKNGVGEYCTTQLPSSRFPNLPYIGEIVEYYAERKKLYTIPANVQNPLLASGIKAGDILVTSSQITDGDHSRNYYAATHLSMVVKTFPESGYVLVAHATSGTGLATQGAIIQDVLFDVSGFSNRAVRMSILDLNANAGGYYQVFIRPNYGIGRVNGKCIAKEPEFTEQTISASTETTQNIAIVRSKKNVEIGKFYTVVVHGNLPAYKTDRIYLRLGIGVSISGASETSWIDVQTAIKSQTGRKCASIPFILPYNTNITEVRQIRVDVKTDTNNLGGTFSVDSVELVEGFGTDEDGIKPVSFTKDSDFTPTVNNYSWCGNGETFIHLTFENTETEDEYTIGAFTGLPYDSRLRGVMVINPDETIALAVVHVDGSVTWNNRCTESGTVAVIGYI